MITENFQAKYAIFKQKAISYFTMIKILKHMNCVTIADRIRIKSKMQVKYDNRWEPGSMVIGGISYYFTQWSNCNSDLLILISILT